MRAAILSIGDELVLGEAVDSNAPWLATQLGEAGFVTVEHRVVGDDREAIARAVLQFTDDVDVLVMTGGLGPTEDDLTRHGLRDAIDPGNALVVDTQAAEHLENWFARRGRPMPESNQVQALRPPSASTLPNPHGTALGLAATVGRCHLFALPGPPREMEPMFERHVRPAIASADGRNTVVTKTVSCFGLGEALAAERLGGLLARHNNPVVGITAAESVVTARIRSQGRRDTAARLVDEVVAKIYNAWHPYAFGSGDEMLSEVIGRLLHKKKKSVATAESCTGGWLGKLLVDAPGCSEYYVGGWVSYADDFKVAHLDVAQATIRDNGAVSAPCVRSMAKGALLRSGADFALAITGIAGPDGGTDAKPLGTVYIALAERVNAMVELRIRHFEFSGNRESIRHRAAHSALQMLRLSLLGVDDSKPMLWERPLALGAADQ